MLYKVWAMSRRNRNGNVHAMLQPKCARFGAKHAALRDWVHAHNCPVRATAVLVDWV